MNNMFKVVKAAANIRMQKNTEAVFPHEQQQSKTFKESMYRTEYSMQEEVHRKQHASYDLPRMESDLFE